MTDIETIRVLIGNSEIDDAFISFYLSSTEEFIKAYCNLEVIPEAMKSVLIEITALRVKANSNSSQAAIGEGLKPVASLSDGNQSISYALGGAGSKSFISEEDFIATFGVMLDRYRRMIVRQGAPLKTDEDRYKSEYYKPKIKR